MAENTSAPGSGDRHLLFSYGTLLDPAVQRHLFGREVQAVPDRLPGHTVTEIPVKDPAVVAVSGAAVHPGLVRDEGREVAGAVLALTAEELAAADAYEEDSWARRRVRARGHGTVWCFLDADPLAAAVRTAVVGDSIAYGLNDLGGGWARRFAAVHHAPAMDSRRVFSLAVPGITLQELSRTAPAEVASRRVDTVLLAAGINDLLRAPRGEDPVVSVARALDAARTLCTALDEQGVRPLVMGPLWLDEQKAAARFGRSVPAADARLLHEALADWCHEESRDFLPMFSVLEGRSDLLDDGLHPTAEGHALMAQALLGEGRTGAS